jgi:voltage-gated potassium channel Kch
MAFQIWFAERVLSVIFARREGRRGDRCQRRARRKIRDHFIVCGYGQVGKTVVEQLDRMKVPSS